MRCGILTEIITEYKTYFTTHPIEKELIMNTINRRTQDGFYDISFRKNEELSTKLSEMIDRVYKVNRLLSCYIDYKGFEKIIHSMDELDVSFLSAIKHYKPISFNGYTEPEKTKVRDNGIILLISNVIKQLEVTDLLCRYTTIKSFNGKSSINRTNMMIELSQFLLYQLKSIISFMEMVNVKESDS